MKSGDKVVCIESKPTPGSDPSKWTIVGPLPEVGRVYVVVAAHLYPNIGGVLNRIGIEVIGTTAFNTRFPEIRGFNSDRFRLLSEMKRAASVRESEVTQ